jgi:pilus assembly protein CpaF
LNVIISGGTGSGKTTLLNVLSGFIPENERILTIEDAAELQLQQQHVLRLETKTANVDGSGETTVRDLVRNSLRMRPDRIVVGECRGGEALDMLQAMNTGHDGSLTTLHANSSRDALSRLETMVLMAGVELPLKVVRQQVSSAVDLIIQQSRLKDGTRKVTAITEVAGMEGDIIVLTDIFKFEQTGIGEGSKILGTLKPTGIRPQFSPRLEAAGFKLSGDIFGASISDMIANRQRR